MPTITPTIVEPVFLDRDTINAMYARYGIDPIGGGSQESDENPDDGTQDDEGDGESDLPNDLGDKGKEALKAERKLKSDALKRAKAAEAELQQLRDEKAKRDEEARIAAEKAAEEQGQFKELAEKRAADLTTVTGERDSLKAQLDSLITAIKPEIEAAWNDVPEEIRAFYDGGDDDVLAKRAFLAKSKPAIDRLNAEQEKKNEALKRWPKSPQPDHRDMKPADDEAARKRQARTVSTI